MRIEKRAILWKPKHYKAEKVGKGITIMHPIEKPDLDEMLKVLMRKRKKWE